MERRRVVGYFFSRKTEIVMFCTFWLQALALYFCGLTGDSDDVQIKSHILDPISLTKALKKKGSDSSVTPQRGGVDSARAPSSKTSSTQSSNHSSSVSSSAIVLVPETADFEQSLSSFPSQTTSSGDAMLVDEEDDSDDSESFSSTSSSSSMEDGERRTPSEDPLLPQKKPSRAIFRRTRIRWTRRVCFHV